MARSFDGTNDNLLCPDNSSPNLNNDDISHCCWFRKSVQLVGGATNILNTIITQNGGAGCFTFRAAAPVTAGFRIQFVAGFSGTPGQWSNNADLPLDTRVHLGYTYNRSLTTNDPIIYVNGASVAITESSTPVGTATSGGDTVKSGENAAGAADLEGILSHQVAKGALILSAAEMNRAMWWGRPIGGLDFYQPLVTTKLDNEGSETGADYTATGTTVVAFAVPTVRPGSSMMGMGIGW